MKRFRPVGYLILGLILGRIARRDPSKLKTSSMIVKDPSGAHYTVQVPKLPKSVNTPDDFLRLAGGIESTGPGRDL